MKLAKEYRDQASQVTGPKTIESHIKNAVSLGMTSTVVPRSLFKDGEKTSDYTLKGYKLASYKVNLVIIDWA